jgi:hypothetical protein
MTAALVKQIILPSSVITENVYPFVNASKLTRKHQSGFYDTYYI